MTEMNNIAAHTVLALVLKKYGPITFSQNELADFEADKEYLLVVTPSESGGVVMTLEENNETG